MIRLSRVRTQRAIPARLRGRGRVNNELILLRAKRDGNLGFNREIWKVAKTQLMRESAKKCAYCEAPTRTVAHGDVDHFRPKSIYWWLSYCYDNLLYACQICNQSYKKAKFPIHGRRMRSPRVRRQTSDITLRRMAGTLAPDPLNPQEGVSMADFVHAAGLEKPALVNPYLSYPERFFRWKVDWTNKEVIVEVRNNSARSKRAFKAVRDYCGLNREELRRERYRVYQSLELFRMFLENAPSNELRRKTARHVEEMMANEAPFAAMVRYFVRDKWKMRLD